MNVKLNSLVRLGLEAKEDRDAGDPQQLSIGPSIQFYLKPLIRLKQVAAFDLNDAKSRFLVVEAGYRYIKMPNAAVENRMQTIVTMHFPLKAGFLLANRNRADLDWQEGSFSWRYRNKTTLQRTLPIHSYHFIPYVAAEPYYLSQYSKWATTDLYAGSLFPIIRHVQIDAYYEHENNTGKRPNRQKYGMGLALELYFSRTQ